MDKSIKKYLTKIIKESFTSDVDEMAFLPSGKRGDNLNKLPQKAKGFPKNPGEYDMVPGSEDEFFPAWWLYNPTLVIDKNSDGIRYVKEPGTEIIIIPTTCRDETEFNQENEEWVQELEEKYGLEIRVHYCNPEKGILKDLPRSGKVGTAYKHSGEFYSESQKNFIGLKSVLVNSISEDKINEILNEKSIPTINVSREHRDMHTGIYTNEKIVFRTHSYNLYNSAEDFLKAVVARMKGKESDEMKTYNMSKYSARRYNTKNANWSFSKPQDTTYLGKTPKYDLNVKGFVEENADVLVTMNFEIIGEKMGNNFLWKIKMEVELGKKLTEDSRLKDGFKPFTDTITVSNTINLTGNKIFTKEDVIMEDKDVTLGLSATIHDLMVKIESIKYGQLLKLANVTYRQTTSMQEPNLNESKERLIRRIVKQIKL